MAYRPGRYRPRQYGGVFLLRRGILPAMLGDYGGNGDGGGIEVIDPPPPPREGKAPPTGEDTDRQLVSYYVGCAAWGSLDPGNPCGFEDWRGMYPGTFETYRYMRRHPTIAHVRRQVFAAILANAWGFEALPNCPPGAYELVTAMFTPEYRLKTWAQMLYGLDYGNSKFEKIWEARDGRWWVRLKPLAVDRNNIVIDEKGNYLGLQAYAGTGQVFLDRRKSFLFTYDAEAGDLHGQSRLENIRGTAWRDWMDAAQQLQWITQKVSGKLCIITTPSGEYTNAAGEKKSYKEAAMMAGKVIADPRSNGVVWFPTGALPEWVRKENIDLIKSPLVQIEVVDFGKYGDAIAPTLERLQHNEAQMSEGYLRSARTNQESQNGSRADSQEHTQNDIVDMELVDADMTLQFCEQVVDDVLEVNYGPKARGTVRGRAGKLSDENLEWDKIIINGVVANPELSGQFLAGEKGVDVDAIATRRSIPKREKEIELEDTVAEPNPGDAIGPDPSQPADNAPTEPTKPTKPTKPGGKKPKPKAGSANG